jgi:hypothetical protein
MMLLQTQEPHILWYVLQNISVMALFVGAVWSWARERRRRAIALALVGALASSLLIRSAEPLASDYCEPLPVTAVTFVSMGLLQSLLVVYLGTEAEWSNWRVDISLGSVAGFFLAAAHGVATEACPWFDVALRGLALAVSSALILVGMRKLREENLTTALAFALVTAGVVTALAQALGYRLILE